MPRTSRDAARRYATLSRRRRSNGPSRIESEQPSEALEAPQTAPEAEPSDGKPVIRHALGETRVNIHPRLRSSVIARPSTFETTDYGYVISDLRRITLVAGVLLLGLIVLSLIVH